MKWKFEVVCKQKEENKSCKGSDNDVTKARATNSKP